MHPNAVFISHEIINERCESRGDIWITSTTNGGGVASLPDI